MSGGAPAAHRTRALQLTAVPPPGTLPRMTLGAVFPPMPTPFDENGNVAETAISSNVQTWVRAGVGGVVALGTNGEAVLLDDDEGDRVLGAARAALPSDRILIAGTGRESTRAAVAAARRAAELGADAVLVRTPSFYKTRMTAEALVAHYTSVADASPVPVLVYYIPAVTGVDVSPETLARLAEHPNILGVKATTTDSAQVAAFVAAVPDGFAVLAGSAPTFYPSLCVGAVGGILAVACVFPGFCVRLLQAVRDGRHDLALEMQRAMTPLAALVTAVNGPAGLKAAMDAAGYRGGLPRAPLLPLAPAALDRVRTEVAALAARAAALVGEEIVQ